MCRLNDGHLWSSSMGALISNTWYTKFDALRHPMGVSWAPAHRVMH